MNHEGKRNTKKTRKQKPESIHSRHCSPSRFAQSVATGTCYTEDEVRTIARRYNRFQQPKQRVDADAASVPQLAKQLEERLGQRQEEWLEKSRTTTIDADKVFRPEAPCSWQTNGREWLSTDDIDQVMRQYEDLYDDFKYLGAYPRDAFAKDPNTGDCIDKMDDVCHVNPFQDKQVKRVAVIFNIDDHTGPGLHWVACYVDTNKQHKNYGIFYYDSVARPPSKDILAFMESLRHTLDTEYPQDLKLKIHVNKTQSQYKNTECGMFSMLFIIMCLQDILDFRQICDNMINDDTINMLRSVIYRPPSICRVK